MVSRRNKTDFKGSLGIVVDIKYNWPKTLAGATTVFQKKGLIKYLTSYNVEVSVYVYEKSDT